MHIFCHWNSLHEEIERGRACMKTRCGGGEKRNVPALTYPIEFSETGRNCSDFVLRQRMCYCSQEDLLGGES